LPNLTDSTGSSDASSARSESTLKIALGVGLSIGLILIGLLAANVWALLRRKRTLVDMIQQPSGTEVIGYSGNSRFTFPGSDFKGIETNIQQVELEQPIAELYQPRLELEEKPLAEMDSSPVKS